MKPALKILGNRFQSLYSCKSQKQKVTEEWRFCLGDFNYILQKNGNQLNFFDFSLFP